MKKVQRLIGLLVLAGIAVICLPLFELVYFYPATTRLLCERFSADGEIFGRALSRQIRSIDQAERRKAYLAQLAADFDLAELSLRSPEGALLFSSSAHAAAVTHFPALPLLRQGKPYSRNFFAGAKRGDEPVSLIEVQVPIMEAGHLAQVVVLSRDVTGFRTALEQMTSRAATFLFVLAFSFLLLVAYAAVVARRAVQQQQRYAEALGSNRRLLEQKHEEMERIFDQVEQSKYEWQLALDSITDMIALIDEAGRIKRCNEAVIRFLGQSCVQILGKSWQRTLLAGMPDTVAPTLQNREIFHPSKQVWLQLQFYPYQGSRGEDLTVLRIVEQGAACAADLTGRGKRAFPEASTTGIIST